MNEWDHPDIIQTNSKITKVANHVTKQESGDYAM